jgi:hypothetical protein
MDQNLKMIVACMKVRRLIEKLLIFAIGVPPHWKIDSVADNKDAILETHSDQVQHRSTYSMLNQAPRRYAAPTPAQQNRAELWTY